ncbi:MAG: ferritin-like domain-containing protein [Acidimicrobiales bacterium]
MSIDERRLNELLVESNDLQVDAMSQVRATLPDLADIAAERRGEEVDTDEIALFNRGRRNLLRRLGLGAGGVAAGGILGPSLMALLARPAAADQNLDVQILQTASSLERLAVATYGAALTLPFIKNGNKVVVKFAETTMMQHDEHKKGFQAQTTALGGTAQDTPNPKYAPVVEAAKPTLTTPAAVVKLAATLETVARDTYLADMAMFSDKKAMALMGSVMGVETQHLATLRAVGALLAAGAPSLIAIPVDASKLPAAAGSVGFSDGPIPSPSMASPPSEGALK